MRFIYISKKVDSCIESLVKSGKAGRLVANKAERIIEGLALGTAKHHMDTTGSFTKYGEKRIKNCRKFNLGCGYRLITLQRGKTVFITFLGSHDECQRWLENNSCLKAFHAGKGKTIQIEDKNSAPTNPIEVQKMDGDVDGFARNLTEKDLRMVFKGLIEGVRKKKRGRY